MAPQTKKTKKPTPWPMKSCSSTTVFVFFGWPDDQIHHERYKSLLDAGQQAWQSALYPEIDAILSSGKETFHQNEAESDVVRRLMSDLQNLIVWESALVDSVHWKPLCKHIAYWSKRRYLASNAWKTLLLRRRRISIRTVPARTVDGRRRSGRGSAGKRDAPTICDGSEPLGRATAPLAEPPSTHPPPPPPPPQCEVDFVGPSWTPLLCQPTSGQPACEYCGRLGVSCCPSRTACSSLSPLSLPHVITSPSLYEDNDGRKGEGEKGAPSAWEALVDFTADTLRWRR